MKTRLSTFAAGMLTMALIGTGALAASGSYTIEVNPINIQVNGQTFQPKDATGADVPVFSYNGTTYAPLRALAEAYGLEVGYDQESNMATVGAAEAPVTPDTTALSTDYSDWSAEDEAAYQEFKGLWTIADTESGDRKYYIDGSFDDISWEKYRLCLTQELPIQEISNITAIAQEKHFTERLGQEIKSSSDVVRVEMLFCSHDNSVVVTTLIVE